MVLSFFYNKEPGTILHNGDKNDETNRINWDHVGVGNH